MQPTMCSRCGKNVAVIFITKLEGGTSKNEGLCLKCAREMGIKPIDDMMKKMGISDEDLDSLTTEMMSAFGGAEGIEGMMSPAKDEDDDEDDGRTATFPFLNQLFGGGSSSPEKPGSRFIRFNSRMAVSARRRPSCRTEVSGGTTCSHRSASSNPAMDISSGTFTPARCKKRIRSAA